MIRKTYGQRVHRRAVLLGMLLVASAAWAESPAPILPVAKGVYRLPYADDTSLRVSNDHTDHAPHNRLDVYGIDDPPGNTATYIIVAAAAGWIEYIQESNTWFCPKSTNGCSGYNGASANCCVRSNAACNSNCRNNYIWMRHPNGEWSKYSHLRTNSARSFGRFVGEFVTAGTPLGLQGDVGFAGGPHLHFEVAVPDTVNLADADDPLDIAPDTCGTCSLPDSGDGLADVDRQNRIPVFCEVGFLESGKAYTAGSCNNQCARHHLVVQGVVADNHILYKQARFTISTTTHAFLVQAGGGAALRAGTHITLRPGFHAAAGAYFSASIGACDSPGGEE